MTKVNKNVILFGPPGIGKSTVIGHLKTMGYGAIDLEDLYPNRIRFQMPNLVLGKILGGADLNPKRRYPNSIKVLLTAEQSKYDGRREQRDAAQPSKASQIQHKVENWLKGVEYDKVVDTTKLNPYATALYITHILKEANQDE